MSFNIGLSGMRAASSDLNVTGNNIANAGTAGFKQSRAEFSDVYAASVMGSGRNQQGSGVLLANVSQQFAQGNITYTGNALDMAVNGNGFFVTSNGGERGYTRAGYFGTDNQGFIVNNAGHRLQGYPVDAAGNLQNGVMSDLRVLTANQAPQATSAITQRFNLNSALTSPPAWQASYTQSQQAAYDGAFNTTLNAFGQAAYDAAILADPADLPAADAARAAALALPANIATATSDAVAARTANQAAALASANGTFDPSNPDTYSSSTSLNIYDTQGNAHVLTQYFVKTGSNTWDMRVLVDGRNPLDPSSTAAMTQTLNFSDSGQLNPTNGNFVLSGWVPAASNGGTPPVWAANGANSAPSINLDMMGSSQYATSFAVSSVSQNGFTTGQLSGLEIDDSGVLFARYTNGQSMAQGQVVLADFANVQGLTPQGNTGWSQSYASGEPVIGTPRSGTLGALQAGALEDSNVELSDQLVNLIVAQRNYQANAKTIETESAITQTIINLR
jgi:flagellar hook protein FlgE